jgi:maltose-binding protein MalE
MKIKPIMIKYILICAICILTISAFALLMIYKPFSNTASSPAVSAADEEQAVGEKQNTSQEPETNADDISTASAGTRQINIYVTNGDYDFYRIIEEYAKKHWSFAYKLNLYIDSLTYSTRDVVSMVNDSLARGDGTADIYCLPARYAPYYIKGEYSEYACTYRELGIDVETALKDAGIPDYAVEAGLNPDGELIALPYLAEPSVFLYNRSVARAVWGTDAPDKIADIIGGGTQKWDKFIEAAKALKKHGYYIVPGFTDLAYMVNEDISPAGQDQGTGCGIDPVWEEYMDASKQLFDSGYINDTIFWTEQWFDDLNGNGDKIFGLVTGVNYIDYILNGTADGWAVCLSPFTARMDMNTGIMVNKNSPNKDLLGPLVEWMTLDCSEEGLQYKLASGTLFSDRKMSVLSGTVLRNADNSRDVLGGQNIGSVILDTMKQPMGQHYENRIGLGFDAIEAYLKGETDKETAINEIKSELRKNGAIYEPYTGQALSISDPEKGEIIVWKDKNFESSVREMLFKPNSDIYTSDTSRVTRLFLDENVSNLEDLEHFKNLENLQTLSGKINDISILKDLPKLKVLGMPSSNISDISVLSELAELEELSMPDNAISDISSLSGLTNLEYINLSYNTISDISALKNLSDLEVLLLEHNDIKDINSLRDLKNLEYLVLNSNKISDISSLKYLTNLKELYLSGNDIADRSPADHVESVTW